MNFEIKETKRDNGQIIYEDTLGVCKVEILADSWNSTGRDKNRLTTFRLSYPFIISPEVLRHRVLSSSYGSYRAKSVKRVSREDIYIPIDLRLEEKGMQGYVTADSQLVKEFQDSVLTAHDFINTTFAPYSGVIHRQHVNRYVMPFTYVKGIVSATEWLNFFKLRTHETAQPEIQVLSKVMLHVMGKSSPEYLLPNQWHIPKVVSVLPEYFSEMTLEDKLLVCSTQIARISYEQDEILRKDPIEKARELIADKHLSPFEHIAIPGYTGVFYKNFRGWTQFRQFVENDITDLIHTNHLIDEYVNTDN